MSSFHASCKNYPSGTDLPSGFSVNDTFTGSIDFPITAAAYVGTQPFLFWDTGRHVTNKRTVHWTFDHTDQWTNWSATAWYGTPGGNGGPYITAAAYHVGHAVLGPTPIAAPPASTFHNGPGAGDIAWPWLGNDHVVNTTWGAGTVHALDHMTDGADSCEFGSWTKLIPGGDDSSVFEENDDDVTTSTGIFGVPAGAAGDYDYHYAATEGAAILAGYVTPVRGKVKRPGDEPGWWTKYFDRGDPAAYRIFVESVLEGIEKVAAGGADKAPDLFVGVVERARSMSQAQLTRVAAEMRGIMNRGEAALKSVEALASKRAGQ